MGTLATVIQVDLVKKEGKSAQQQVLRIAEQLNGLHTFERTFWVSALRTLGIEKLKDFLMERCFSLHCLCLQCAPKNQQQLVSSPGLVFNTHKRSTPAVGQSTCPVTAFHLAMHLEDSVNSQRLLT